MDPGNDLRILFMKIVRSYNFPNSLAIYRPLQWNIKRPFTVKCNP